MGFWGVSGEIEMKNIVWCHNLKLIKVRKWCPKNIFEILKSQIIGVLSRVQRQHRIIGGRVITNIVVISEEVKLENKVLFDNFQKEHGDNHSSARSVLGLPKSFVV